MLTHVGELYSVCVCVCAEQGANVMAKFWKRWGGRDGVVRECDGAHWPSGWRSIYFRTPNIGPTGPNNGMEIKAARRHQKPNCLYQIT